MRAFLSGLARAQERVLYIPLDERPVNLDYVIAAADFLSIVTLTDFLLPDHKTPAPVDRLWDWAFKNARSTIDISFPWNRAFNISVKIR
ncbi:DUF4127 family protein [Neomoorella thermoacetica]|uniref:DUF4127 family protein n=1 Tax=Neomoorella thermoacetica TaxID=1525 RepID=UPI0008FA1537|nr:DUF4127 family protein [Moorella thermoacetica]OIQ12258.1 hypothetical protein MOOTH_08950 [Moorella thermoacetica]